MSTAISIKNVSKKYVIGKQKDGSLRGTLAGMFSRGQANTEEFLALNDVSFDIQKGDVVGIIGKNGAGKSTLLKILSQITKPSTGSIEINGRVASLLEVGTGFHPELTGRENVYLNGTILGMTRKEVKSKFDEIVAFSGVEKFIDTPVKHYSSGMYVRLAFAVAAHLEPEILIIDEVLAVGDAEFQKKCLGKMGEVAGEGRTVLFVSHNLTALKNICDKGIVLDKGRVCFTGNINDALVSYNDTGLVKFDQEIDAENLPRERTKNKLVFANFKLNRNSYFSNSEFSITIDLKLKDTSFYPGYVNFGFHIVNQDDLQVYHLSNLFLGCENVIYKQDASYIFSIDQLNLKSGIYKLWFWLEADGDEQDFINEGVVLEIQEGNRYNFNNSTIISGVVQPLFSFKLN